MSADDIDGPKSLIVSVPHVLLGYCGNFLVGRHSGRRNVMRKEVALSTDMEELNGVVMSYNAAASGFWKGLRGNNLPLVIEIFVRVTGDLLPLTADTTVWILERVGLFVRMQIDFSILVFEGDGVIVAYF